MSEFLNMGGYAAYVWSAFGVSVAVLAGTVWLTRRGLRQTREQIRRRLTSAAAAGTAEVQA